jgi:hypothetical protein
VGCRTTALSMLLLSASIGFRARAQSSGLQLEISYQVLQRALSEQLFTDEGRLYVRANRSARCSFAYLEQPEIGAESGQLRIRARFTGRSGYDLFGRCLGLGDSFPITILSTPYYTQDAKIALKDICINTERGGVYHRAVKASMRDSLQREFRYDLANAVRRALEQPDPTTTYRKQVVSFRVEGIRPEASGVVVKLALALKIH